MHLDQAAQTVNEIEAAGPGAKDRDATGMPGNGVPSAAAGQIVVIQPSRGWEPLKLKELWDYRELLYFLMWRDFKVRYKQTVLGVAWAIIQPVTTMIVFSIVFGKLANLPSDGIPYPVFTYAALLPWLLFSGGLAQATNSVASNSNLVKKVYLPRLVMPTSSVLGPLIDFPVASVIIVGLMLYFGLVPPIQALVIPLLLLFAMATALGAGLWLTSINTRYRDVRHATPFLIQVWMYSSPVAYSGSLVPESWRLLYAVNPLVSIIEGFRWAMFGTGELSASMVAVSLTVTLTLLVSGAFIFRRTESTFADLV